MVLACLSLGQDPVLAAGRGTLQSGNLTILYDEPLRALAEEAARIYPQAEAELSGRLNLVPPPNPVLVLIGDPRLFDRMVEGRPILAFAVPQKMLMVVDGTRVGRDPFAMGETLRHEMTHLMVHHHVGRKIPSWLDEGLAQWVSGGLGELLSPRKKSLLRQAVLSGRLIRIQALSDGFPTDERDFRLAYAQSESIVTFIIGRYGLEAVLSVLDHLKAGDEWEAAIERGLGASFAEVEGQWLAKLQKERSWFLLLSPYLFEILFAMAAVALVVGFLRAYLRKRAYFRNQEEEEENQDRG